MRYFFAAIAIVAVLAIAVPSFYGAMDVEGEFRNASPSLSAPPTLAPEAPRDPNATPRPTATGTAGGQQIAARSGCTACHSINGSDLVGPTWQGLAGRSVTLANGDTVTADDAYIQESIVSPNAKVVEGFEPGIMPQDFGTRLTPEEIQSLIAYIKTLQ
jgi:mono/diheme cytochrome c family protein